MSVQIIEDRVKEYGPTSQHDELNAIKQVVQEIALCALARNDFFKQAAFQGGTCLRIVHHLNRFSEDLDFLLVEPNKSFVWEPFLQALQFEFLLYKLEFQVIDRSKADAAVKLAFIKDNSFGKVLLLKHPRGKADKQTIQIKLEIDTNPPAGSQFQTHFLDFPVTFSISAQDLPSLFASKCHALLCRPYLKGRDWYDFAWYVSKKIIPRYVHLEHAIEQAGAWRHQKTIVSKEWLLTELQKKIETIDWFLAKQDVQGFLRTHEQAALDVWGAPFFSDLVVKLSRYLPER